MTYFTAAMRQRGCHHVSWQGQVHCLLDGSRRYAALIAATPLNLRIQCFTIGGLTIGLGIFVCHGLRGITRMQAAERLLLISQLELGVPQSNSYLTTNTTNHAGTVKVSPYNRGTRGHIW